MWGGWLEQGDGGGRVQQDRASRRCRGAAPPWGTLLPWLPFLEER